MSLIVRAAGRHNSSSATFQCHLHHRRSKGLRRRLRHRHRRRHRRRSSTLRASASGTWWPAARCWAPSHWDTSSAAACWRGCGTSRRSGSWEPSPAEWASMGCCRQSAPLLIRTRGGRWRWWSWPAMAGSCWPRWTLSGPPGCCSRMARGACMRCRLVWTRSTSTTRWPWRFCSRIPPGSSSCSSCGELAHGWPALCGFQCLRSVPPTPSGSLLGGSTGSVLGGRGTQPPACLPVIACMAQSACPDQHVRVLPCCPDMSQTQILMHELISCDCRWCCKQSVNCGASRKKDLLGGPL